MIYLIKTTRESLNYIRERITTNGWSFVSYDTIFFVDIQNITSSLGVYDHLSLGDNQPDATIVVRVADDENYHYWGRADTSVWEWLRDHSRKSIGTWEE